MGGICMKHGIKHIQRCSKAFRYKKIASTFKFLMRQIKNE